VTSFLSSLGSKLAERWLTVLLLPGAGFLLALVCAADLGHAHAADLGRLATSLTTYAQSHAGGAQVAVLAVVVVLGSSAAALCARAVGRLLESVWIGQWPAFLATRLIAARRRRAGDRAAQAGISPVDDYSPEHPTWMGERFRLLNTRIMAQYQGLQLGLIWPRLWVLLAEPTRVPVQAANASFEAATVLAGWGILYLVLGLWWFPALLIGAVAVLTGWRRGRAHTESLATLIESTVDTHLVELGTALNLTIGPKGLTRDLAARINDQLNKGA
jgi:hypothetical protein